MQRRLELTACDSATSSGCVHTPLRVCGYTEQQSRAECRAEQSRAGQSRAEQSAEQSRAEQSRAEQGRAEQSSTW